MSRRIFPSIYMRHTTFNLLEIDTIADLLTIVPIPSVLSKHWYAPVRPRFSSTELIYNDPFSSCALNIPKTIKCFNVSIVQSQNWKAGRTTYMQFYNNKTEVWNIWMFFRCTIIYRKMFGENMACKKKIAI